MEVERASQLDRPLACGLGLLAELQRGDVAAVDAAQVAANTLTLPSRRAVSGAP
jgi:hypothetical protein